MSMLLMTEKESYRIQILCELAQGKTTRSSAAEILGISLRQLDRVKKRYAEEGPKGLTHKNRGKKSSMAMSQAKRTRILELVGRNYSDYGPTLAAEKLRSIHGEQVSKETVRQIMIAEGLWREKKRRRARVFQRRTRRSKRGELVQGDASPHDWFEGRGPRCSLVAFIDDATGRVSARFEPSETTDGYCRLLQDYIAENGCPGALYVDKSSIFCVNRGVKSKGSRKGTVFGQILKDLKIELICANSPQAKGRIERFFQTMQDRLVKEMRAANVSNIEEANWFLGSYLPRHNAQFAKSPASTEDGHHPVPQHLGLYKTFTRREKRQLSGSLDFSYEGTIYQVIGCKEPRRMKNQPIIVYTALDGKMWGEYQGNSLEIKPYKEIEGNPRELDRKQLDAWLDRKLPMTVKDRIRRGMTRKGF